MWSTHSIPHHAVLLNEPRLGVLQLCNATVQGHVHRLSSVLCIPGHVPQRLQERDEAILVCRCGKRRKLQDPKNGDGKEKLTLNINKTDSR